MDIKSCGSVISVAYHVAKYASKCEPGDSEDYMRAAGCNIKIRGGPLWDKLFSVSLAILS